METSICLVCGAHYSTAKRGPYHGADCRAGIHEARFESVFMEPLAGWLETPGGGFASYMAEHQRSARWPELA